MKLIPISLEHTSDLCRWISDKEAVKYSLSAFFPERSENWALKFIRELSSKDDTWDQVIFYKGRSIGYCGLCNISSLNNSAEYYILIGDKEYWGKGLGTEAGRKVLEYGFNTLNLHRIWLTVSNANVSAIKSYEKLGFVPEGIMRDAAYRNGCYYDKVVMGMLRSEFHNKSKAAKSQKAALRV